MIKNFFKIACRNLLRNKVFSIINIGGLATGMASAMLILLSVQNEISYSDKSLKASGNLVDTSFFAMFSYPLIKEDAKLSKNIFGKISCCQFCKEFENRIKIN